MRTIPDPGFAGDQGDPDPALAAALAGYGDDREGGYLPAVAALCAARLIVPVVAQGEESDDVDMAAVLIRRPDGDTALVAFSGLATLAAWDASARPVPTAAAKAALAAIQEGAIALVVDFAGPVQLAVEHDDLVNLARGWRLVPLDEGRWGWDTGRSAG